MATRMSLWRLEADGSASPVPEQPLDTEEQIESAVESAPQMLGINVLIIGRQTQTPSGPLDLLAIDAEGQLVVVENKRGRTPRDVLAQTIDYAAWVNTLNFDEVENIYVKYQAANGNDSAGLADDFEEHFGEPLDAIADVPRMIVVASHLDGSTERMIDFLNDSFDVPVNAVLFQPFDGGLIGRTWLRPDADATRVAGKRSSYNAATREQAKQFWDAWLPVGRSVLTDIRLPKGGPRSVYIKRAIVAGSPAKLQLRVNSSDAYAEIQFDDDDPEMNAALLTALERRRTEVESTFGPGLDWRAQEVDGLRTKRTKVVTPKIVIEDQLHPSEEGMDELAQSARRLVDAVKPFLAEAAEAASVAAGDAAGDDHGES